MTDPETPPPQATDDAEAPPAVRRRAAIDDTIHIFDEIMTSAVYGQIRLSNIDDLVVWAPLTLLNRLMENSVLKQPDRAELRRFIFTLASVTLEHASTTIEQTMLAELQHGGPLPLHLTKQDDIRRLREMARAVLQQTPETQTDDRDTPPA
jgi:hypothetical protein